MSDRGTEKPGMRSESWVPSARLALENGSHGCNQQFRQVTVHLRNEFGIDGEESQMT